MHVAQKQPLVKRFWWWLKTGHTSRPGRAYFTYLRKPSPWTKPWRAWQVILRRRRVHVVPLFYVIVCAFGAIVGVVLQLTLGISWWITPLALGVFTWLWFFSTIWRGGGPEHSTPLREELLAVFQPQKAQARRRAHTRTLISDSGVRFFAPVALRDSPPSLSYSASSDELQDVTLTYWDRDPRDEGAQPFMSIMTLAGHAEEEDVRREVRSQIMSEALRRAHELELAPERESRCEVTSGEAVLGEPAEGKTAREEAAHEGTAREEAAHEVIVQDALRQADALRWSPAEVAIGSDRVAGFSTTVDEMTFTYCRVDDSWVLVTEGPRGGRRADAHGVELGEIHEREALIERMLAE